MRRKDNDNKRNPEGKEKVNEGESVKIIIKCHKRGGKAEKIKDKNTTGKEVSPGEENS